MFLIVTVDRVSMHQNGASSTAKKQHHSTASAATQGPHPTVH